MPGYEPEFVAPSVERLELKRKIYSQILGMLKPQGECPESSYGLGSDFVTEEEHAKNNQAIDRWNVQNELYRKIFYYASEDLHKETEDPWKDEAH